MYLTNRFQRQKFRLQTSCHVLTTFLRIYFPNFISDTSVYVQLFEFAESRIVAHIEIDPVFPQAILNRLRLIEKFQGLKNMMGQRLQQIFFLIYQDFGLYVIGVRIYFLGLRE